LLVAFQVRRGLSLRREAQRPLTSCAAKNFALLGAADELLERSSQRR
jgi:hypothetical protein